MRPTFHAIAFALAVLVPIACGAKVDQTQSPPSPSSFDIVEVIAEESVANNRMLFQLENGREVEFDMDSTRVLFRSGGAPRLLIGGRDATGDWLVVVGKQDGLPSECNVVNRVGREWGSGIDLFGILWPKSRAFHSDIPLPALESPYPDGTRFCLDDSAHVSEVIGH